MLREDLLGVWDRGQDIADGSTGGPRAGSRKKKWGCELYKPERSQGIEMRWKRRGCVCAGITEMEWDHGRWAERRGGCGPSHRAKPSIRLIVPILLPAMPLLLPVPFSAIAKSPLALDSLSLLLSSVEFGPLPRPASHLRRCQLFLHFLSGSPVLASLSHRVKVNFSKWA